MFRFDYALQPYFHIFADLLMICNMALRPLPFIINLLVNE